MVSEWESIWAWTFCSQSARLMDCFRLLNAKSRSLGRLFEVLLIACVGCLVISLFFIYLKWPFDSQAEMALGKTKLGLNVRGCGREAIICCQWTALKVDNFNPGILLGSAGWQAVANEAFQVRCGDRFLSSLKKKSLPWLPHLQPTAKHARFFFGYGVFKSWKEGRKYLTVLPSAKAPQEQLYLCLLFYLIYIKEWTSILA